MRHVTFTIGAAIGALLAGAAQSQAQAPFQGDRQFIDQATSAGQSEITAGQLAAKQGSPATRVFGRWMVADHTLVNGMLDDRAKDMGIALPGEGAPSKETGPDLTALQGDAFDKPYLQQQVADHRKAVALFENESASGHDAALKHIAEMALPGLREHLAAAEELSGTPAQ